MNFVLKLAYREIRSSWRRLIFFFLCIAIGVGSIVALRSLLQNLKATVTKESRSLLTADVQVAANAPFTAEQQQILQRATQTPAIIAQTALLETATMVRPVDNATATPKLVELKAVQAGFPFYGELALANGQTYSHDLLKNRGVLVRQAVLTSLNLSVGAQILINDQPFTIRGIIDKEPGNSLNAFSVGPRVILDYADAANIGLLGIGSRARYRVLFKTQEGQAETISAQLKQALQNQPLMTVRSFRFSQDRMSNSLTQVEDFLSLIGLVILVLGGIGISSVTRVFINQKMKTIAILKTLGGQNNRVLTAYLAQVLLLGLFGSLLGLLIAKLVISVLPHYFAGRLPLDLQFTLTWSAIAQGLGIGLLIALLFSLVPLLEIRRIKPLLVLRSGSTLESTGEPWWRDVTRISVTFGVCAGVLALASWQAGSFKIGAIFLAGLAAMALLLNGAAWLLMHGVQKGKALPIFAIRQGLNSLYRPGNQTRIILLAVGLGVFFVVAVRLLQINLLDEFAVDLNNANRADLYLIDIQRDQLAGLRAFVKAQTGNEPPLIPTVRSRIVQINGNPVKLETVPPNQRGLLEREYVLTYRPQLDESEKLISGQWWPNAMSAASGGEPEISIEELLNRELKLALGDRVTFDILGKPITARVTSIRRVDWRNARTGFLVVFQPGALDAAPTMYVSPINAPAPALDAGKTRAQFQRALADQFPNISFIDVYDILESARGIIGNVSLAISFVGGFVFLSGLLILVGSIAMTKFHRLYESAILKTLGAKRKLIIITLLVEYGVLGLLAGTLGSTAAIALTWAICEYGLKIGWRFMPFISLLGIGLAFVLVMLIGVSSSWDVLVKKPLGILRSE